MCITFQNLFKVGMYPQNLKFRTKEVLTVQSHSYYRLHIIDKINISWSVEPVEKPPKSTHKCDANAYSNVGRKGGQRLGGEYM